MAYTPATLTGTYQTPDGTPAKGTVEIIPNSKQIIDAVGDVILAGRVKVTLDELGSFSVNLPPTDDASLEPATGRQYTVVAKLHSSHLPAITGVELAAGETVDVADVSAQPETDALVTPAATEAQLAALEESVTTSLATKADADDATALEGRVNTVETNLGAKQDTATLDADTATHAADPDSDTRAVLSATYARAKGAGVARSIAAMRAGQDQTWSVIGDSIADPTTAGNTGGGPVEKLAAIVEARFGVTITIVNEAESGFTAWRAGVNGNADTAVAAVPDCLFICLGKNDIGADINGLYAAGYTRPASMAALERFIVAGRRANEAMDAVIVAEGPYTAGSASNDDLRAWQESSLRVATTHGAEWIDVYQAFLDYGDYSGLMYDSTHQNPTGNDLYATTMADHFDAEYRAVGVLAAPPAERGLFDVSRVDFDTAFLGYASAGAPGSFLDGDIVYTTSGAGWVGESTSTPGDYVEVSSPRAVELGIQVDTSAASNAVVDVVLDGVTLIADLNLSTQGKQGTYWLTPVVGLDGGAHALRFVLKSGTLNTYSAGVLLGAATTAVAPEIAFYNFGNAAAVQSLTDGATKYAYNTTLSLPTGWSAAEVMFQGHAPYRVTGTTTTVRTSNTVLRIGGVVLDTQTSSVGPIATASEQQYTGPVYVTGVATITGNTVVRLEGKAISTDKGSFDLAGGRLMATLRRTA